MQEYVVVDLETTGLEWKKKTKTKQAETGKRTGAGRCD